MQPQQTSKQQVQSVQVFGRKVNTCVFGNGFVDSGIY
jgi:hypothetical protein